MNNLFGRAKKLILYIASIIGIGVAGFIVYSPFGFALRLADTSIFRATMSIMSGVLLGAGFIASSAYYMLPDKQTIKTLTTELDITELSNKLKKHENETYMGDLASQALTQVDRLNNSIARAEYEIMRKFDKTTLAYQEFFASVSEAGKGAFENLKSFANRLQLYSEEEFIRLKHYKEDNIPDDIQIKQIELMQRNYDLGKEALTANENLIYGLDELAMELASANFKADTEGNKALIDSINELSKQVRYFI